MENLKKAFSLFVFLVSCFANADIYEHEIRPVSFISDRFMSIRILDSKELKFSDSDVNEISALAFKDNVLYGLGDRGFLYHFDIKIKNNKIKRLVLKNSFRLKNENSKRLKKSKRDSEGLCFMDENLLISFERKPRVDIYSKDGIKIDRVRIHKDLADIKNYQDENKALESVAYNKKYGVITAPESSLEATDKKLHTIYAEKKKWTFPASGKITALEFMDKDEIMVLQRSVDFFTWQRISTISRLNLKTSKYDVLAVMDSKKGWRIDNFEGLTKVGKKKYLIISDDNDSFFQKTLLVLFEVD